MAAGRKPKYTTPTVCVAVKMPQELVDAIRASGDMATEVIKALCAHYNIDPYANRAN